MSNTTRSVIIGVACLAAGIAIGQAVPSIVQNTGIRDELPEATAIKKLAMQHLAKETADFAPGSDVDVVFEVVDRQPNGTIMVVGLCRLVSPKPGGINSGRFWLEFVPQGGRDGYEVRNISCHYGITQDGFPWTR